MEGEPSVNNACLNLFFYALKLASENNIEKADRILRDLEARYNMSYIFMKHAINEILGKHSNFSKSCAEQGLI